MAFGQPLISELVEEVQQLQVLLEQLESNFGQVPPKFGEQQLLPEGERQLLALPIKQLMVFQEQQRL